MTPRKRRNGPGPGTGRDRGRARRGKEKRRETGLRSVAGQVFALEALIALLVIVAA
ncbi:hypothetical protein GT043_24655, partial [Streptomyces sp. SID2131]|nr:hypothetical protein [Streptomyces sp. SID2131]